MTENGEELPGVLLRKVRTVPKKLAVAVFTKLFAGRISAETGVGQDKIFASRRYGVVKRRITKIVVYIFELFGL